MIHCGCMATCCMAAVRLACPHKPADGKISMRGWQTSRTSTSFQNRLCHQTGPPKQVLKPASPLKLPLAGGDVFIPAAQCPWHRQPHRHYRSEEHTSELQSRGQL